MNKYKKHQQNISPPRLRFTQSEWAKMQFKLIYSTQCVEYRVKRSQIHLLIKQLNRNIYTLCPNWSDAKIKNYINKTQLNIALYHFNLTNYYLFTVKCTSVNKIHSIVFFLRYENLKKLYMYLKTSVSKTVNAQCYRIVFLTTSVLEAI